MFEKKHPLCRLVYYAIMYSCLMPLWRIEMALLLKTWYLKNKKANELAIRIVRVSMMTKSLGGYSV